MERNEPDEEEPSVLVYLTYSFVSITAEGQDLREGRHWIKPYRRIDYCIVIENVTLNPLSQNHMADGH